MIFETLQAVPEGDVDCDILIIGAGPAGITIATELEATGLSIVVLESGGEYFDDRAQALNNGEVTGLDRTDLMAARLRIFGGATNHWGGHCLPLDPIDFERAPLSGLSGWPIGLDEMKDPYTRASAYCDIGALDYSLQAIEGLSEADLLLPDDPRVETRSIRQSAPTNFGEKFFDKFKASQNIQAWFWMTAVGIEVDADGQASSVEAVHLDGGTRTFRPRDVILACGAVENARFLLGNNARLGASFGNAGGFLGRCYMDHTVGGAAFLHLDTPIGSKAYWRHDMSSHDGIDMHVVWRLKDTVLETNRLNNTQFFLIPFSESEDDLRRAGEANQGYNALKSIAKWGLGRAEDGFQLTQAYCEAIMNADALALRTYHEMVGTEQIQRILLRYESEQQPDKASYVDLSDKKDRFGQPGVRLNWSPTLQDRDSIVASAMLIGQSVGAAGLGRVELEDHFDARYWDASTAWHQLGTTRMSVAPSDGVVDPNGRVHGTQNLYVAGGSVMPSGGRANPTLTIVALALRLSDHLAHKQGSAR